MLFLQLLRKLKRNLQSVRVASVPICSSIHTLYFILIKKPMDINRLEKVNGYSYRMVADKIRKTQEAGDTYLSGDARYVVEEGTGITEGSEFYLFLPGTPRSELPQGLIDSVNNNGFHSMDEITPDTYILYNPIPDSNGYDLVFISTPEEHNLQSQGAAAADRRLTSLTTYSQDGSIWYHHVFSWDENGNLI